MSGWDADLYQRRHGFVWEHGRGLVETLAARPEERILDLGCGTGELTASLGARVIAADRDAAMLARAAARGLRCVRVDARALPFDAAFDAVFSNAVLHWVRDAETAARGIARALRPGGRFVAEFGGHGNVATVARCVIEALSAMGVTDPERFNPWFFPTIGEYASILERAGLSVASAALFERPTPLEGPLREWLKMFSTWAPADDWEEFAERVEEAAAPELLCGGVWTVDYVRLRVIARKP